MELMVELVWLGRIVGECGVVGEVHIEDGDEVWLPIILHIPWHSLVHIYFGEFDIA